MANTGTHSARTSIRLSKWLTLTIVFMALGTGAELILIDHYEDAWQLVPIVLIGSSLLLFVVIRWVPTLTLVFRILMALCVISGMVGAWLHLKANMEFESELHASSTGWTLFVDSLSGALPTLAPGSMIVFGLIGYSYTLLTLKQNK